MESKLPKPSGLKRPLAVLKKKAIGENVSAASSTSLQSHLPLTGNLSNIREGVVNRAVRGRSPDLVRPVSTQVRTKLRRSRSVCDIREIRQPPVKRSEFTALSNKTARFGSNITLNATGVGINRPPRIGTAAAKPNTSMPSHSSALTKKLNITTTARGTANKKNIASTSTSTASSLSTAGGKTINKRIPPYDYKARFLDLQEKHKHLKLKYESTSERIMSLENLPEKLEECEISLFQTQEKLKFIEHENESLLAQVEANNTKINSLIKSLSSTETELHNIKQEHELLCKTHDVTLKETVELRERVEADSKKLAIQEKELELSREQLFTSNIERKELHNTVMDLRGNIRVFCRVRPPLELEADRNLCVWNYLDDTTVELQSYEVVGYAALKTKPPATHTFSFDQVFHPNCTQDDIFEMVSPLIQSALDGFNICIFAYGQTGSGKTYTMDGTLTSPGVIPRTVDLLFDAIKIYKRLGWQYEIKANFLEIYNEVLYDLLSNEQKDLEIRMVKNSRNDIYVSNITEEVVASSHRLRELMGIANMNRATAATAGNERSSRSHAVTRIELIGRHVEKNEFSVGTINLVDLAGSESPKTSIRMNETKNINRSLSELTNVILALLQKQDHVPYRNSKLTHLLMPSLGGNSKTLMFINVSPFQDCFGESVKSLRFAASVNACKMAKAKRNRHLTTQLNSSTTNSAT